MPKESLLVTVNSGSSSLYLKVLLAASIPPFLLDLEDRERKSLFASFAG